MFKIDYKESHKFIIEKMVDQNGVTIDAPSGLTITWNVENTDGQFGEVNAGTLSPGELGSRGRVRAIITNSNGFEHTGVTPDIHNCDSTDDGLTPLDELKLVLEPVIHNLPQPRELIALQEEVSEPLSND